MDDRFKKIGAISILSVMGGFPAIGAFVWSMHTDIQNIKVEMAVKDEKLITIKTNLKDIKDNIKEIKGDIRYIRDRVK